MSNLHRNGIVPSRFIEHTVSKPRGLVQVCVDEIRHSQAQQGGAPEQKRRKASTRSKRSKPNASDTAQPRRSLLLDPALQQPDEIEVDQTMTLTCNGHFCRDAGVVGDRDGCMLTDFPLPPISTAMEYYLQRRLYAVDPDNAGKRHSLYTYFACEVYHSKERMDLPDCVIGAIRNAYPNPRGVAYAVDRTSVP
eukprot:TRINITY_DN12564_c0_g2_i4.p1 TRINITY_DN12564_c0_g2~~TRINITY_DN12564_c0_g2_i4.p1  ORF type:complete len:193 (+),score=12.61 TRINITY_DN12564_c0_g2_i4:133-711(+)